MQALIKCYWTQCSQTVALFKLSVCIAIGTKALYLLFLTLRDQYLHPVKEQNKFFQKWVIRTGQDELRFGKTCLSYIVSKESSCDNYFADYLNNMRQMMFVLHYEFPYQALICRDWPGSIHDIPVRPVAGAEHLWCLWPLSTGLLGSVDAIDGEKKRTRCRSKQDK